MNILLSNDDGFMAPGINLLRDKLSETESVVTVAPDRDRSGASNSLTLDMPLRISQCGEQFYNVNGTPTDCVHLALTGLYDNEEPDMVISGINAGANMGDDVIYSGTVAAAMEGRNLGLSAMAVSLASFRPKYFNSAVMATLTLLRKLPELSLPEKNDSATIINVNVPDLPWEEIRGFEVTRLGKRHKAEPVIRSEDARGHEIFWVGPVGEEADAGEGTDFYAIQNRFISVTPIHIDLTNYNSIQSMGDWLCEL